ncbi:MAG: peptidylprolyl isomerase [Brevundimonas sp.]|uniref:peptidylprolyl isomerase n=1 Tax=Brevundimonas sp. TaxID=1871086 RepID=UPI0012144D4D|nr:peptidylprolyl isomerase [Brevundimonas sp.]RZJ16307.1 MAG: peptidylprolyl isomerase [Brevundimonas sp.]
MIATSLMTGLAAVLAATVPVPAVEAAIHTTKGDIVLELDAQAAPLTTCNFIRYVQAGRYRDATFFRTVVRATNANPNPIDVIQAATTAGSDDPGFGPIALERTRDTGLMHVAGTISMARDGPDTATSSFFIVTQDTPSLDFGGGRNPDGQGFAAFGKVTEGLELVRAIQALPATDEQITAPVAITNIELRGPVPAVCGAPSAQ